MENNNDIRNILLNKNLDEELMQIEKHFSHDIETLNLMEENNLDVLNSINLDSYQSVRKIERILDNKIIIDSIRQAELLMNSQQENDEASTKEDEIKMLLETKIFFLSDKKITKIANLDIYENLEELYLQRNFIRHIEGLKYLKNLQILNLNNNYIRKIENISNLDNLLILDLAENLIENFDISDFPKNVVYLYLFDNLFYDEIDLLYFRSNCIKSLCNLERLDYLTISEKEKFILMDQSNIIKNRLFKITKDKLSYIYEHYKELKNQRKIILKEFEETPIAEDIKSGSEFFLTNSKSLDTEEIKKRAENILKDLQNSSSDRMKDARSQLEEIKNKFKTMPFIDDDRKDKIKEKINLAIKTEEKIKKATELNLRLEKREVEDRSEIIKERNRVLEEKYLNYKNITTDNEMNKSIISHFSEISNKNSLLSDASDISYINKKNK